MNTSEKDEYVEQMKAKLDEINAEIDRLEAEGNKVKAQTEQEYHKRLAELKRQRDDASEKLENVKTASGEAWEKLKDGADKVFGDVRDTLAETRKAFVEGLNR